MLDPLQAHYALYGEVSGVRTARKHIGWYVRALPGGEAFRARMNTLDDCALQLRAVADFFDGLAVDTDRMPGRTAGTDLQPDEEVAAAAG